MTVRNEQPLPVGNDQPVIHRLVQADLEQRLQLGIATYGQPLQPHNGRDALRDLYEELLDGACYIKQAMVERDHGADGAERPQCVAHGRPACQQCHLTRPGGLDVDGNCSGCETYSESGLHWDTCPNRAYVVLWATDDEPIRAVQALRRRALRTPTECPCYHWAVDMRSAGDWYGKQHHPACDGTGQRKDSV